MRLIDADKVAKNVFDRIEEDLCQNTPPYNCDELEVCLPKEDYEYLRGLDDAQECAVNTINKEPTVEAIPIVFIKQLIKKFDCERGNAIKDTFAHILTGLLEFWEFEQEKENDKGSE